MEKHIVKIEVINEVTHDVLQIKTEKPNSFNFDPGCWDASPRKDGYAPGITAQALPGQEETK